MEVNNAKHLRAAYRDITSLKVLDETLKEAAKETKAGTWIIDEVNIIYEMIVTDICETERILDLSELGFGKGWSAAKKRFREYIRRFLALPGGHIFTAHEEEKQAQTRNNRSVSKSEARLSKEANRVMEECTHSWFVMNFDADGNRYLQIKGDDYVKAGHGFEGRFTLIEDGKIPLGNSPEQGYRNFVAAWNNEPIKKVVTGKKPTFKVKTNA